MNHEFYERMSDLRSLVELYERLYTVGSFRDDPLIIIMKDRAISELSYLQQIVYQSNEEQLNDGIDSYFDGGKDE